ncbi:phospholipase [Pueribacillus theae]|uniref:Phospholipase n=1 Tax=Pueribacillus theae TaxID=2171751 RepID=A0A2U1JTR8_9BACI|nr:alpha/beta hydrolase [Pueribacillus theae]PWA08263.1 phospholipase [Pueribacillus theae]
MKRFRALREAEGTIVIVHGAGEHSGRYEWLIRKWNESGFHVVTGDLPGQGESPGRRGHIQSFQDYVHTVEKWVKEASSYEVPVFLFGHSMGGLVVIRTMLERELPIKAVILSSPCLGLVNYPKKPVEVLSKLLNVTFPKIRFDSNIEPGVGTRNEEMKAKDETDPLYNRKVSVRWYRELRKAMANSHEQAGKFPNVPLLLLQGGDDRIVDIKKVKSWFNQLQINEKIYKEWDGLFHEVFNEPERRAVFDYTLQFVRLQLQM